MRPGITRSTIEVIRKNIAGVMQDVHVALPGQVVGFSQATGLADVQVMIEHPVWDDDNNVTYEDIGVLPGVPVSWPRAGGFIATFPIAAGDTGLLVFCSTPIGEWRATGQKSQPADASRHDIGWPVFIPGFSPDTKAPSSNCYQAGAMVIGSETGTGQVIIKASEVDIGQGATDFIALASLVMARLNTIQSTFDGHTHAVSGSGLSAGGTAVTGSATSAAPGSTIGTLANVAATIGKAK